MASIFSRGTSFVQNQNIKSHFLNTQKFKLEKSKLGKLLDDCMESLHQQKSSVVQNPQKRIRKVVVVRPSIHPEATASPNFDLNHTREDPDVTFVPPPPPSKIHTPLIKNEEKIPWIEPILTEIPPPPIPKNKEPKIGDKTTKVQSAETTALKIAKLNPKGLEPEILALPLSISDNFILPLFSEEKIYPLLTTKFPKILLIAMNQHAGTIAKKILTSEDTCKAFEEPCDLILYHGNPDIKNWEIKDCLRTVVFLIDNEGNDTRANAQISTLASHFIDNNVTVKVALPRAERTGDKRTFLDLFNQRKGLSRCSRIIRNAVIIESPKELAHQNQPLQEVLQKICEKREFALNRSTKESMEHRINAAVAIYNKAEPIGPENVIAVNLWLRGIPNLIPANFRAIMIPHPDWPEERNREIFASRDKRTGLLSSLKVNHSLEKKIIAFDNQYWTVMSDIRWKDSRKMDLVVSLKLKNYRGSLNIVIANNEVQLNQQTILDPDSSIFVCDFKLYTRIIPYYNNRGELTGIERTFFGPNAGKPHLERKPGGLWKSKLARGVTCGSSARLYGKNEAPFVILGEGAENVLSALHVIKKSPRATRFLELPLKKESPDPLNCQFIASLGVNDLIKIPLKETTRTVILLADNDGYNMETKQTLIDTVDHFLSRKIKVKIALAIAENLGKKKDINDLLTENGFSAAEEMLCQTVEITSKEDLGTSTEILQLCFLKLSIKEQLRHVASEKFPKLVFELGQIHSQLEKHQEAIACYQEALVGATGKLKMQILDALGAAWLEKKEYDLALESYEKSLKEKVLSYQTTDHLEIAQTLEGIGNVYADKNVFDMAFSYYTNSLQTKINCLKSDTHEGLSSLFYEFGNLYLKQRNFDLALFNYQKSLQLKQKEFGTEIHPMIAKIMEKIGDAYYRKTQYVDAVDSYKRSIEILQRVYCSDRHKLDEEILLKIAKAYYLQNNIPQSLEYYVKSFCVQKQTPAPRILKHLLERANQIQSHSKNFKIPEIKKTASIALAPKLSELSTKILSIAVLKERAQRSRQIALDIEMTGSLPLKDRITEIGCVVLNDFHKTGMKFQAYVNPERSVRPEAHRITGLTQRFLQKHPPFPEIAKDFLTFIQGADLIIHAADSDLEFLKNEFNRANIVYDVRKEHEIIDTLMIAKKLYPNQKNSLDALNARLNINRPRPKHGALLDAEILADVYLSMLSSPASL